MEGGGGAEGDKERERAARPNELLKGKREEKEGNERTERAEVCGV